MEGPEYSLTKTILEMDLVAYSDVARLLEENLSVEAVKAFQDQIRHFVDHGLELMGLKRDDIVMATAGDNAILMFDDAATMHKFAQAVQAHTMAHNAALSIELAKRWFRMGAATGTILVIPMEHRIVGSTIARAVRLEAAAKIGQLVVDPPTFNSLPDELKELYGSVDIIKGKRSERFEARRCTLIDVSETPVGDRLPFASEDMGEQSVKSIVRPVRVYALDRGAAVDLPVSRAPTLAQRWRWLQSNAATALAVIVAIVLAVIGWRVWPVPILAPPSITTDPSIPSPSKPLVAPRLSIVVLPFANLSDDPKQQYFADGITEDLTTDLSRLADMLVISRSTAFTYKDRPVNARQIGRELGVRYLLEGSVQRSGNKMRINAQLIDAENDTDLWAERFDRDIDDLFALQNEITGRIAIALNVTVLAAEVARGMENNPDALDYILQGRAALAQPPGLDNYGEAINSFEQALTLDPQSIEAKGWLASALVGRVLDLHPSSSWDDLKRAELLANQALAGSPGSMTAHLAKGQLLRVERRCEEAIPEFEMVIASNRNSPGALFALGECKLLTGSIDEAIPLEEQAVRLGPRDPYVFNRYLVIGKVHLLQSRIEEAIVWLERARIGNPGSPWPCLWLASAYALKGEADRAATELDEARRLLGEDSLPSIAQMEAHGYWGVPKIHALFETTYFAGLRKAGVPEE